MKLLAIWIGKLALFATRVLHFGSGTTLPGLLAEKIDPNIIGKLTARLRNGAIVITGTNGKTTTAKMLTEILKEDGFLVLNNKSGSNMTRGIASALVASSNIFGSSLSEDTAVFEVDEATMREAMSQIRPKITVVTNLFRDQLDRYGELDKTAEIIGKSLQGFQNMTTVLNADDPLVSSLGGYASGKVKYFGVEDPKINTESKVAMDSKDCLVCGHELDFSTRYFGHLGIWKCPNCGNERPKVDFSATNIQIGPQKSVFELNIDEKLKVEMQISGLYNVYNALAAASAAKIAGCAGPATVHALKNFSAAFGRMEILEIEDKKAMLLLVKNPTGANQAIAAVLSDDLPKKFLFCLNDNFADGTDVSWIWDIDFEVFELSSHSFICSGIRAYDMALRFKYAGVDNSKIHIIEDPIEATIELAKSLDKAEIGYILPTYTAMIEVRQAFSDTKDQLSSLGKVTKHGV